ncbi:hypothetical protein [Rothia sp. P4278]|uniref:hypothetical protein n=1 Tax=Rothia sp. P4278 TaxID=3402658 RepID=UPI003AE169F2
MGGLRPATDADLQAYAQAHQGALATAGNWVADNWEYVAGGTATHAGHVGSNTGIASGGSDAQ